MKMKKFKIVVSLFFTMLKIGLFTFGGGYAMIAILKNELIEKKKWLENTEFYDILAIAESTPGPIAINSSTYVGYKLAGFAGAFFATLGVCIPSFVIIYVISVFFDRFLEITFVSFAFKGIRACVCYLILSAGIKMIKELEKNALTIILFILSLSALLAVTVFSVKFSSLIFIVAGGATGLCVYAANKISAARKKKKVDKENDE